MREKNDGGAISAVFGILFVGFMIWWLASHKPKCEPGYMPILDKVYQWSCGKEPLR